MAFMAPSPPAAHSPDIMPRAMCRKSPAPYNRLSQLSRDPFMRSLIHELVRHRADMNPTAEALGYRESGITYEQLAGDVVTFASALREADIAADERVAVYLEKRPEAVAGLFGAAAAGGAFVPVNPLLKPAQVGHILRDCNVRALVTSSSRLEGLTETLRHCPDLHTAITVDGEAGAEGHWQIIPWHKLPRVDADLPRRTDSDLAAILYTSGS
ncbi:MAG: AMP-binding protein, partial [Spiribacter salinus]